MAQRSTERGAERSMEREAQSATAQSGDTGMMHRQGGAIAAGPFSLIDWMLDRLQRDFFGSSSAGAGGLQALSQGGGGTTRIPRLNVSETDSEFVITAEVPGVDPNDVQIEIEDDVLTLRAEAREVREEGDGQVISYTRFFTQIPLPDGIDIGSITASSKNGMVTLRFPKQQQERSVRRIPVSRADGGDGSGQQQPRAA
jgi:HSP20 family protein